MSTDNSLQVYLKLNELRQGQNSTKEVHDFSQNEYHGVVQGSPTPTAEDRFGSCINLGKEDSIKIDKGSQSKGINLLVGETDSFTLGFWFKPSVEGAKEGGTAIVLSVSSKAGKEQQTLTIVQKTLAPIQESTSLNEFGLQVEINGKKLVGKNEEASDTSKEASNTRFLERIKYGEWNHIAIAIDRKAEKPPKIEVYLNEFETNLSIDDSVLKDLALKDCVIEIAPQSDQQKFIGQVAHLRIYNELLPLTELKEEIQDDETATSAFNKSHPIEFDLRNENDEHVLYISDKEEQSLILEITNTSAEDIEVQVPEEKVEVQVSEKEVEVQVPEEKVEAQVSEKKDWQTWKADESCYHFQLSFRPGTLSDFSIKMLQSPKFRLLSVSQGWDCVYDPDDKNLVDWISFLWVGDEGRQLVKEIADKEALTKTKLKSLFNEINAQINQLKDPSELLASLQALQENQDASKGTDILGKKLNNGRYGIPKKGIGIVKLGGIGAAVGGGARGTRVHLKYNHLSYSMSAGSDATKVPIGTRSQFLNIINRQGKANIPLHVGFVGSNTVLNDGNTSNELTLRITNLQKEPLSLEGGNGSPQFRIYFDFEDRSKVDGNGVMTPQPSVANGNKQEAVEPQSSEEPEESWFQSVLTQAGEVVTKLNESAPSPTESDEKPAPQPAQLVDWKQEWSISSLKNAQTISVVGRDPDDQEAWKIVPQDFQTPNPHWLLEPNCQKFAPKESFEFVIQNLISDAPDGFASLYVEYKNIPGYWDGRIICSIEKSPLVYRQQAVGIGTDAPQAKLHVSVKQENAVAGLVQKRSAAVFEGGNVGIGITAPISKLQVNGTVTATEFVGYGAVVKGMIVMWSGAEIDIPSGWKLCDGANGMPDLRSRFLVGAGKGREENRPTTLYSPSDKGDADTHTHSMQTPQFLQTSHVDGHTHKMPSPWYDGLACASLDKTVLGGQQPTVTIVDRRGTSPDSWESQDAGGHSHQVNISSESFSSDSYSGENRPRWYALCFIIYVGL